MKVRKRKNIGSFRPFVNRDVLYIGMGIWCFTISFAWAVKIWKNTLVYRTWRLYAFEKLMIDESVSIACIVSDPMNGAADDFAFDSHRKKILSFVPPIPGAPASMFANAIYYRTVPASQGRTHMPAWRCKGYFKVTDTEAIGKITSFNDPILNELISSETTLEKNGEKMTFKTDILCEEGSC